jgi:hypothetical protein
MVSVLLRWMSGFLEIRKDDVLIGQNSIQFVFVPNRSTQCCVGRTQVLLTVDNNFFIVVANLLHSLSSSMDTLKMRAMLTLWTQNLYLKNKKILFWYLSFWLK